MTLRPYGTWPSPISADGLAGNTKLSEVAFAGDDLVWLEGRSGTGVLVAGNGESARELAPDFDVRAEVGYGGGDFSVGGDHVYFVKRKEGRLYQQSLAGGVARPITPAFGQAASPTLSPDGTRVAYVHHDEGDDRIALVDSDGRQWPQVLCQGRDFYAQPQWSSDGQALFFIAWDHPHMPWEGAALFRIDLRTRETSRVVGTEGSAVFQPLVVGDTLFYVSDEETGFGQLWRHDLKSGERRRLTDGEAEHGLPLWVQGMRSYCVLEEGRTAVVARCEQGVVVLTRVDVEAGRTEPIGALAHYTEATQLCSDGRSRFGFLGAAARVPPRVVSHDLASGETRVHARASDESVPPEALALAEPIEWTVGDERVFGIYYPPHNPALEGEGAPPLVVLVHGGPTAQVRAAWNPQAQFFATRGYAVLLPNYRGSVGYGREYVQRLNGQWGVLDVEDAVAGARHLAEQGLADGGRCVIMGGSAGGYTVLQAMVNQPEAFAAGISYYGVSDLFGIVRETHKFEARYLDSIVGPLPDTEDLYRERSPVNHAHRIRRPLAVFQGDEDRAVPKAQSDAIVAALAQAGVPHIYHVYEGEGHGFRKSETIAHFYAAVEAFLAEHVLDA